MWTELLYEVTKNPNERCSRFGHTWGEPRNGERDHYECVECTWCGKTRCPSCKKKAIRNQWSGVDCSCGWWFCL